jgi:hypothetical protein
MPSSVAVALPAALSNLSANGASHRRPGASPQGIVFQKAKALKARINDNTPFKTLILKRAFSARRV